MNINWSVLDTTELLTVFFRSLYGSYGYERYRMSKFEDYDLYGRNKEFLVSENLITFTDMKGRLKALKPDVTLSIIKNNRDPENGVRKLYYDEKVYRVSGESGDFREIAQSGIECFGAVDDACIGEVLTLAVKSLALSDRRFVLSVSDLDVVSAFIAGATNDPLLAEKILRLFGERNAHGIEEAMNAAGVPGEKADVLAALIGISGPAGESLPALAALAEKAGAEAKTQAEKLESVLQQVPEDARKRIELDFSVVGNTTYYNGVIFKGFVEGVPERVLSGGQYDGLMKKLGRASKAVGFAVYLDTLERLDFSKTEGGRS